ncbi:MAG: MarR family transcriptional regulator [Niabella sp.]
MNTLKLATELRTVTTRLVKKMRTKTPVSETLSLTERSTVFLLHQHGQLLPSELAAAEKVTTQSMSQILNHLSAMGLIRRTASVTDKRKTIISLSKKGEETVNAVRDQKDEWLHKALLETCNAKNLQAIEKVLPVLAALVEFE